MPSVDHCVNKTSEMTTITNSLEVFDTYKHREDKDSDEESFHLPLDDDESESKFQETVKNGNGNETEEEILNKFDSATAAFEPIDSQLEERLLDEEEEERKLKDKISETRSTATLANKNDEEGGVQNTTNDKTASAGADQNINCNSESKKSGSPKSTQSSKKHSTSNDTVNNAVREDSADEKSDTIVKADVAAANDVPKLDAVDVNLSDGVQESSAIDKRNQNKNEDKADKTKIVEDKPAEKPPTELNSTMEVTNKKDPDTDEDQVSRNQSEIKDSHSPTSENASNQVDKTTDKCENSNDSSKNQNEDSEDLFDISIIRDAEEDNAESAYNEAHPDESHNEDNEDYDDRNDDKAEEDSNSDKANNLEEEDEEEEMDIDKHDDQLKNDDVEIEETNLKLDCEGIKESSSDGESDNSNRTDLVNKDRVQDTNQTSNSAKESTTECRLDEVTGNLIGGENVEANCTDKVNHDSVVEKQMDVDSEGSEKRKSLKRTLSEENETGVAKKSRTEQAVDVEIKEVEKPKEKLPLRTLLSLSDFMKSKKSNKRLTMHDLEEFCLQKICEVIVHKSDLGDVHHQLKLQEQLIETMRKEIQQLTKQARDLEIVNKKLMNDLKQQNATQKPLNPLKITRSVGLQVKFTPAFEANMKRRQPNAAVTAQKVPVQPTTNRGPRNIPNALSSGLSRQVNSPQKQQQPLPKPNTPLLSQALQNRRAGVNDITNKTAPQAMRTKASDAKNGTPSASVIDLTDEDDKKDKNKNGPAKMVTQKNITVPLRTTPMRVNTTQGIRLTTSQGKVSPITSVVTSSAPQVMYVVQSSPQNVLTSPLGSKAVVVNFQSANGVLTSTLNGSALSVIPKPSNTTPFKSVAPTKTLPNKVIKIPNKHPAPLPPPPVIRVSLDKPLKPIPPKPHLTIRKTDTGIILQWKMPYELDMYEVIASYQLYAYQETSASPSTDMWRKVGDVKALALPMACTLTQFADKNKYYFAVRPVDIHKRIGVFSEPEEISL